MVRKMRKSVSECEVVIEYLGANGDGIAATEDELLYIPMTLPGEKVRVKPSDAKGKRRSAKALKILEKSVNRVIPSCKHFGDCGGCSTQHLSKETYLNWKQSIVLKTLERIGANRKCLEKICLIPPRTRRRAEFSALRIRGRNGRVVIGFHARESNRIVDIEECKILHPRLQNIIQPLRNILEKVLEPSMKCDLLATDTSIGIDLLITTKSPPRPKQSLLFANFAEEFDLARVSWSSKLSGLEPIALRRHPVVTFNGVNVAVPPGVFLQASTQAEKLIIDLVIENLATLPKRRAHVADLFSGIGTLTIPIAAAGARVKAIDNNTEAINSLLAAAGAAGFSGRVNVENRNLFQRPLIPSELKKYHAVVFDPPRSGAASVARNLSISEVPLLIAVSCNPATFARDASIIISGGYTLNRVTPVDQFVYSKHIELVAMFTKNKY